MYGWKQLHAGRWHYDIHDGIPQSGKYWTGNWRKVTPEQLLEECFTTIEQLLENHPELIDNTRKLKIKR
jgi:hypothetical protein